MKKLKLLIQTLWKYMPNHRKVQCIVMLLFSIISKIIWLANSYILGKMINLVQEKGIGSLLEIKLYVYMLIAIPFLGWCFHGTARVWQQYCLFDAIKVYKTHLFSYAANLSMEWHSDNHSGTVIDRVNKATSALDSFGDNMNQYIYGVVNLFVSIAMLLRISPKFLFLIGPILLVIILIIRRFDIDLVALGLEKNEKEHKVSGFLFDYLSNIKTLITLRFQSRAITSLIDHITAIFPTIRKYALVQEVKRFFMDILSGLMVVGLTVWYIYTQLMQFGTVQIGNITMILQYMGELRYAFDNITRYWSQIIRWGTDISAVDVILDEYKKEHQKDLPELLLKKKWNTLSINYLNFSYSKDNQTATLSDISLRMHSGQKIAFVGESGSGKSTMLALLRGLYTTDQVEVNIDGVCYENLESITEHTSLIPQDPEIFENTIRYNITCGLEVNDTKILEFCRLARFDDVVASLPNGLDTDIKEKGVNLSGGQKQRLALARGLLLSEDSDILLLDEPTSSVDAPNEKQIFTKILHFFDNKTIIAVLHRLHLLEMFDYIYVFDQGRIIEEGTFKQLVAQNGKLAQMWREYRLEE